MNTNRTATWNGKEFPLLYLGQTKHGFRAKLLDPNTGAEFWRPGDQVEETTPRETGEKSPAPPPVYDLSHIESRLSTLETGGTASLEAILELRGSVARLRADLEKARPTPTVVEVRTKGLPSVTLTGTHRVFPEILATVNAGFQNLYLVGPAGTGKTTVFEHLAKALGRQFGFLSLSAGVNETHLFGRLLPQADGSWAYQQSEFVRIYTEGGVFLFDEIDAADSNVLLSVNAAMANGHLANPVSGKIHKRHETTILGGAANTYGTGSNAQYVGRNPLDASTRDRFVGATIEMDYDQAVEATLVETLTGKAQPRFLQWVWALRAKCAEQRIQRVVSTRMVLAGARWLASGLTQEETKKKLLIGWTPEELRKTEVLV